MKRVYWPRLFGLMLMDYLSNRGFRMELEKDLSLYGSCPAGVTEVKPGVDGLRVLNREIWNRHAIEIYFYWHWNKIIVNVFLVAVFMDSAHDTTNKRYYSL